MPTPMLLASGRESLHQLLGPKTRKTGTVNRTGDGKQEDVQQDGQKGIEDGSHLPELDENGECEHGGDGVTCPPCVNKRKGTVVPEPLKASYHFVALFDGRCRGCDLPISKGSWVTRWSDDTVKHYGC